MKPVQRGWVAQVGSAIILQQICPHNGSKGWLPVDWTRTVTMHAGIHFIILKYTNSYQWRLCARLQYIITINSSNTWNYSNTLK